MARGDQESKVRAKRIAVGREMVVESRTLGVPMSYMLATENLSRSGILLHGGRNRKVPYRVNTLLELTIDTQGAHFDQPVNCLGKIVRMTTDPSEGPRYGVQIIQLEGIDLNIWEKGVSALEEDQRQALPAAS